MSDCKTLIVGGDPGLGIYQALQKKLEHDFQIEIVDWWERKSKDTLPKDLDLILFSSDYASHEMGDKARALGKERSPPVPTIPIRMKYSLTKVRLLEHGVPERKKEAPVAQSRKPQTIPEQPATVPPGYPHWVTPEIFEALVLLQRTCLKEDGLENIHVTAEGCGWRFVDERSGVDLVSG